VGLPLPITLTTSGQVPSIGEVCETFSSSPERNGAGWAVALARQEASRSGDPRNDVACARWFSRWRFVRVRFAEQDLPLVVGEELRARGVWLGSGNERDHEQAPGNDAHDHQVSRQALCMAQAAGLDTKPPISEP
jgi:hypothetical protein